MRSLFALCLVLALCGCQDSVHTANPITVRSVEAWRGSGMDDNKLTEWFRYDLQTGPSGSRYNFYLITTQHFQVDDRLVFRKADR